MRRGVRFVLIGLGAVLLCLTVAVGGVVALYSYVTRPITDLESIGDGAVTTIVTDHFGPVAMAAYLFELADGQLGLVDSGGDAGASNIRAALASKGKATSDVRVILLTHGHDDHSGGVAAFSAATVYALAPDVEAVRRRRTTAGATGQTLAAAFGTTLQLAGTTAEVFAMPGHTRGSAAYLVHGVLFLGDSAQSLRNGTVGPNTVMSEDGDMTTHSMRTLVDQLRQGAAPVRHVAFGHSGSLTGIDALISWSAGQ